MLEDMVFEGCYFLSKLYHLFSEVFVVFTLSFELHLSEQCTDCYLCVPLPNDAGFCFISFFVFACFQFSKSPRGVIR